jgi:hypothetical protein
LMRLRLVKYFLKFLKNFSKKLQAGYLEIEISKQY